MLFWGHWKIACVIRTVSILFGLIMNHLGHNFIAELRIKEQGARTSRLADLLAGVKLLLGGV